MFTHWHTRSVLLTLLVLPCALIAGDTNDPANLPTFRSTVSEVRVTFFALDQNRHPVTTLTKSEMALRSEWERIQRHIEDQLNDPQPQPVDASIRLRTRQ
jgi:hypothetical protein